MSSTPKNKNSKPTTPPKTLGWSQALFGSTWLSSKKTSHVDSSTGSTASKASLRPSPKPFQNLEGFNAVHSPDQGASKAFTTVSDGAGVSTAVSALPIQQSGRGTQTSTAVPSKSPWKASPMGAANGARFSVGNLKPSSLRAGPTRCNNRNNFTISTTARVEPVNRVRRRNKYKTSGIFQVRRNNRGHKTPIDKVQMNKLLLNARPAIEAPRQKIESDRNFRTAFANRKCRPGVRLHPSDKGRLNGRLPIQQQAGDASTRFLSNGKRNAERDDDQETIEAASTRKKRRVNFGGEENNVTMPIENLVSTPAKDSRSRSSKRKATPYKVGEVGIDEDDDNDGEDMKMASSSNRKLLKIKRSPSSKKSDPKSGANNVERPQDFPVMLGTNTVIGGDLSSWSTSEELESSITIKSNMIIPDNFMTNFPPAPAAILSDCTSKGLPQFQQKPLFVGEKKDRTVRDDDDDETGQDAKRSRAATWNCKTCGMDNDDDETHCQVLVDNGKGGKKKCGEGRTCEVKLGWGSMFEHLTKGKVKCEACSVLNDKSATHCVSCEAPLSSAKSSTGTNDESSALASTAKVTKPSALGGSNGSEGFSFGGGATAGYISSTGFSFGNSAAAGTAAAPSSSISSSKITTGGFTFGAPAPSASSSTASSTTASGGFQFGSSSAPSATTKTSATIGGFQFGAPVKEISPSATSTAAQSSPPPPTSSDAAPKPFTFGSSSVAPAPSPSPNVGVTAVPTPLTGTNSGAQLFGNFATSSTPGSSSAQAPKFSFGTNKDTSSTSNQETVKVSTTEPASTTKDNKPGAPAFSFGSSSATASTTAQTTTPGFSFGSSSAKTSAAPTDSAANATFSFGANAGSSTGSSSAVMPSLGSVATEGIDDRSSKKKRRGGFVSNTVSSSQPNISFGSKTSSEVPALDPASTQAGASAPFLFGNPSTNPTKDNSSIPASGFVSSIVPLSFGNTSNNSLAASGTPAPTPALTFGSTPAPAAPLSFGSTPAPALTPAAPFSFGSTMAPAPVAPAFGSTVPAPAAPMSFGSTLAAGPSSGFGSTPAPSNAMHFGSATPAQSSTTFGSTSAAAPGFGAPAPMAFGSSTPAHAPVPFGSTPAVPPQPFGNNAASTFNNTATTFGTAQPTAGAAPLAFGGPAPPAQAPGGFGVGGFGQQTPQQQPPAPPNAGFSLGTGGGGPRGRTPGKGRRIVRARRPGGR
jgi:hypothetical protein